MFYWFYAVIDLENDYSFTFEENPFTLWLRIKVCLFSFVYEDRTITGRSLFNNHL